MDLGSKINPLWIANETRGVYEAKSK